MQEVILAVSHAGWFSSELIRGIVILFAVSLILIVNIRMYFLNKKRRKEWERDCEFRRKQERRIQKLWDETHKPKTIKRRTDHPLTTIFKNEMPKSNYRVKKLGERPSDLAISKGNF